MSTRSYIAITKQSRPEEGMYEWIYCHNDGYIQGVGQRLIDMYKTPKDVQELIDLGDISSLGTKYDSSYAKELYDFNFGDKFLDVFTSYKDAVKDNNVALKKKYETIIDMTTPYSVRGEDVSVGEGTLADMFDSAVDVGIEYIYVYCTLSRKWYVKIGYDEEFVELAGELH